MKADSNNKTKADVPSLLRVVLIDLLIRHWFISVLVVLFVFSSMMRAHHSHKVRRLTAEWQNLRQEHHRQQLLLASSRLELTTISEANRILELSKKKLGMVEVTTKNEVVLSL